MGYSVFSFPAQQIPYNRKDDEWRKQCVDWGVDRTSGTSDVARGSLRHMRINYDLVNGRAHVSDFTKVLQPEKFNVGFIPDDIQHYPIINPKLNLLIGEESKRVFEMRVIVTNPTAVSDMEREKANVLRDQYIAFLQDSNQDPQADQRKLEAINEYMTYEYQDMREIRANALLNHYSKELNFSMAFNTGFKDALTVGQEMYKIDIISGEPTIERLDPRNVFVFRSGNSDRVEDADIVVIEDYWAVGRIYDTFYDALTDKDRKYIEDIASASGDSGDKAEESVIDSVFSVDYIGEDGIAMKGDPERRGAMGLRPLATYDESGNIRVVRVYWKSRKKILKVKSYDDVTGETIYNIFPEDHVIDESKGEEAEELWVNEAWEGTKIGDDVYVNIRPMPVQFCRLSNPSRCHFGIIGSLYNLGGDRPFSLVDMMKPYNYMYDVIHDRLNRLIAKNWGNLLELDLASLPQGFDIEKWMYYARESNLVIKNSFSEGSGAARGKLAGGLNNASKGVIPFDMGQTINSYVSYLEYLKKEMSEVVGISPQREGSISNRETVGGVERATVQSAHITEWLFSTHNDVKRRVYEAFLEVAKAALQGQNLKFNYILSDNSLSVVDIDGDEFSECDYGLSVDCSNEAQALKQSIETLARAALQTQTLSFSSIMKLYSSSSLAEKQRMVEKAEKDAIERQQQQMQQEQQMAQQQLQAQQQAAQMQAQMQAQINKENNDTKIKVAQIEAMTRYETTLTNVQDPRQFEESLQEKRRQFNERLDLDKESLELKKQTALDNKNAKDTATKTQSQDKALDRAQKSELAAMSAMKDTVKSKG